MRYLVSLIIGIAVGVLTFAFLLYVNPLAKGKNISPLSVTESSQLELSYAAVPANSVAWVNNGQSNIEPFPDRVQDLWEATIEDSEIIVTMLTNSRSEPVGVGIKFSTVREQPGLLRGEYPVDSAWHLWLTGRGGLLIDQSENRWSFLREVVVPAYLSSANSWAGTWYGILTSGPGALGTARITGGSGDFAAASGEAVEAMNAKAYSADLGPVSIEGRLTLSVPNASAQAQ